MANKTNKRRGYYGRIFAAALPLLSSTAPVFAGEAPLNNRQLPPRGVSGPVGTTSGMPMRLPGQGAGVQQPMQPGVMPHGWVQVPPPPAGIQKMGYHISGHDEQGRQVALHVEGEHQFLIGENGMPVVAHGNVTFDGINPKVLEGKSLEQAEQIAGYTGHPMHLVQGQRGEVVGFMPAGGSEQGRSQFRPGAGPGSSMTGNHGNRGARVDGGATNQNPATFFNYNNGSGSTPQQPLQTTFTVAQLNQALGNGSSAGTALVAALKNAPNQTLSTSTQAVRIGNIGSANASGATITGTYQLLPNGKILTDAVTAQAVSAALHGNSTQVATPNASIVIPIADATMVLANNKHLTAATSAAPGTTSVDTLTAKENTKGQVDFLASTTVSADGKNLIIHATNGSSLQTISYLTGMPITVTNPRTGQTSTIKTAGNNGPDANQNLVAVNVSCTCLQVTGKTPEGHPYEIPFKKTGEVDFGKIKFDDHIKVEDRSHIVQQAQISVSATAAASGLSLAPFMSFAIGGTPVAGTHGGPVFQSVLVEKVTPPPAAGIVVNHGGGKRTWVQSCCDKLIEYWKGFEDRLGKRLDGIFGADGKTLTNLGTTLGANTDALKANTTALTANTNALLAGNEQRDDTNYLLKVLIGVVSVLGVTGLVMGAIGLFRPRRVIVLPPPTGGGTTVNTGTPPVVGAAGTPVGSPGPHPAPQIVTSAFAGTLRADQNARPVVSREATPSLIEGLFAGVTALAGGALARVSSTIAHAPAPAAAVTADNNHNAPLAAAAASSSSEALATADVAQQIRDLGAQAAAHIAAAAAANAAERSTSNDVTASRIAATGQAAARNVLKSSGITINIAGEWKLARAAIREWNKDGRNPEMLRAVNKALINLGESAKHGASVEDAANIFKAARYVLNKTYGKVSPQFFAARVDGVLAAAKAASANITDPTLRGQAEKYVAKMEKRMAKMEEPVRTIKVARPALKAVRVANAA